MIIRLIRHTKVNLPPGICYGHSDVPLVENWESEAEEIIRKLQNQGNPLVFTSPLKRCRLLAEKISNRIIEDNRLKELNFGSWELIPWDDIHGSEAEHWMNNFVVARCPGGESYLDLHKRVKSFLYELPNYKEEEMIIVTHAGVIRALMSIVQKISLHNSFEISVSHGQIISLHLP